MLIVKFTKFYLVSSVRSGFLSMHSAKNFITKTNDQLITIKPYAVFIKQAVILQ